MPDQTPIGMPTALIPNIKFCHKLSSDFLNFIGVNIVMNATILLRIWNEKKIFNYRLSDQSELAGQGPF